MYSKEELQISNRSYINKDFPTIYNELLDTAVKISNRFDPTTSNESDPFIVLTKLIAFVGDKINYNVDKNILERFLTSITQYNSMYERTSSMGYNMHYYQSAIGNINIRYNGSVDTLTEDVGKIIFPALQTKFTTSSQNINYILLDTIEISNKELFDGTYRPGRVIQGELNQFKTIDGDNTIITLNNLDENNRLYFPEVMVAENGVFITQKNSTLTWSLVDNLNTQLPETPCYIFRYDSVKKLSYIQFPDDISSLIGEGLTIQYIITNGKNGNVIANEINTLLTNPAQNNTENEDNWYDKSNYTITNPSALTNGQDMENIDEAYFNFQKTVGTFDTLVTCRDYANYIYNMRDDEFNELCSNVQVCDRRDDYNFITKVATFNEYGPFIDTVIDKDEHNNDKITAFDLCLYPLQAMLINDIAHYKTSFTPVNTKQAIINGLENSKCLSHNYNEGDIYAYKVYYELDAKITTTTKVNELEQLSIRNNIIQALIDNFNARKVDYGKEIPYDTILKVIEQADSRIKFVSLNEPELKANILYKNGTEVELLNDAMLDYIADNVLAGNISLFNYYDDFTFRYNEAQITGIPPILTNIDKVSTCAKISLSDNNYILQPNEVIQILQPNLIEKKSYGYGWFYEYNGSSNLTPGIHFLTSGSQVLTIYDYNNPDEIEDSIELTNCYIKVTETIQPGLQSGKYRPVSSGKEIITLDLNKIELKERSNFYWITNTIISQGDDQKLYSRIDWQDNKYILKDGEYLYQTDNKYQSLYAYGPGTLLTRSTPNIFYQSLQAIDREKIEKDGLNAIKELFVTIDLNNAQTLTLTEQQVITLTSGDKINSNIALDLFTTESGKYINNLIQLNNETLKYTFKDNTSGTNYKLENTDYIRYIRARLDINCGPNNPQQLYNQTNGSQYIYISTYTLESPNILKLDYEIKAIGGEDVSIQAYSFTEKKYISNNCYMYNQQTQALNDLTYLSDIDDLGYYILNVINGEVSENTSVILNVPKIDNKDTIIMIYCNPNGAYSNKNTITNVNSLTTGSSAESGTIDIEKGINVLKITASLLTITFGNGFTGALTVSQPVVLDGVFDSSLPSSRNVLNPALHIETENEYNTFIAKIMAKKDNFYFTTPIDNSRNLDIDNIKEAYNLFNINNVINKIVIPEIDIDYASENITIAKSSQL